MKNLKHAILEYIGVFVGCALTALAFVLFIYPYKLVPGGVYGTSLVLHNLMPDIMPGTFGYMISIPLLIISYFLLGKGIGVKTLLASLVTPALMNIITMAVFPDEASMKALDPTKLMGGCMDLTNDLILATIIGPVIYGIGEGIMMRCKATSGGSDIVALLIHKYLRVKFSHALMAVDAVVVLFGLLVIGMGLGTDGSGSNSWVLSGYSLICIFVASKTLAYVVAGTKNNKLLFIITNKNEAEMRNYILNELDRTATAVKSYGLYSNTERTTLMMVVSMREVDIFTSAVKDIDPDAFVIVTDAYDTYGERWQELPEKHSLQLS